MVLLILNEIYLHTTPIYGVMAFGIGEPFQLALQQPFFE